MKKIQWKKVFLAGFAYMIIATVVWQIEAFLTMDYYMDPQYFGVWSKVMMPTAGPPPVSFFLLSLSSSFVTGVTVAALYDFVKGLLPVKFWPRVLNFTDLVIGLMVVFFTLPVYLLINVPFGLLVSWFLSSLVIVFIGAVVFVKLLG